jgi:hypothetical protein
MDKLHEDVLRMQRNIVDYIKQIVRPVAVEHPMPTEKSKERRVDLDIQIVDEFPCMPELIENISQSKDDLEGLLRRYLNAHYSE